MIVNRVKELLDSLDPLDPLGRVAAELALVLADRVDFASTLGDVAQLQQIVPLSRELRSVLSDLTRREDVSDALLARILAEDR